MSGRTMADYLTCGKNVNPYAADQMGLDALAGFRRKVFALICVQAIGVWACAAAISRAPIIEDQQLLNIDKPRKDLAMDAAFVAVFWVLAIASLCLTAYVRYSWPKN